MGRGHPRDPESTGHALNAVVLTGWQGVPYPPGDLLPANVAFSRQIVVKTLGRLLLSGEPRR